MPNRLTAGEMQRRRPKEGDKEPAGDCDGKRLASPTSHDNADARNYPNQILTSDGRSSGDESAPSGESTAGEPHDRRAERYKRCQCGKQRAGVSEEGWRASAR